MNKFDKTFVYLTAPHLFGSSNSIYERIYFLLYFCNKSYDELLLIFKFKSSYSKANLFCKSSFFEKKKTEEKTQLINSNLFTYSKQSERNLYTLKVMHDLTILKVNINNLDIFNKELICNLKYNTIGTI